MEGDAFEMEDQRNWTDASYKTYVRPLAFPWGYTLAKGSRHAQSARLSFTGRGGAGRERARGVIAIELRQGLPLCMPELVSHCRMKRSKQRPPPWTPCVR
jgi:hypothetical protein